MEKNKKENATAADKPQIDASKLEKALKLSNDALIAEAIRDVLIRDSIGDESRHKH